MSLLSPLDIAKMNVLEALAEGNSIKDACNKSGLTASAHYQWLRSDPSYQEGYKFALKVMAENVILPEYLRRAVHGVEEVKTFTEIDAHGNERITGRTYHKKFPDTPMTNIAKAHLPELFTERIKKEVTTNTTVTIADTLAAARGRLRAARGEDAGE